MILALIIKGKIYGLNLTSSISVFIFLIALMDQPIRKLSPKCPQSVVYCDPGKNQKGNTTKAIKLSIKNSNNDRPNIESYSSILEDLFDCNNLCAAPDYERFDAHT